MADRKISTRVARLEALAQTRLGLFSVSDATAHGLSSQLLEHHNHAGGRWSRVLPGVYQLAGLGPDRRRPLLAALLWGGDQAVLSHRAAGFVLRLDGISGIRQEMWAPTGHSPRGIIVHRGIVGPDEVVTTGLLRHTTLLRTVRDLAAVLNDDTLELVIESALRRDPTSEGDLVMSGRNGTARLRRVLGRRPFGAPPTDSELETRYLQVIRMADVPPPVRQHRVINERGICIGRLDLCWPEVGLWVELDGRASHDRPKALLYDRHRQNEVAVRLQWLPIRFTWDDVTGRPRATARFTEDSYRRRAAWLGHAQPP